MSNVHAITLILGIILLAELAASQKLKKPGSFAVSRRTRTSVIFSWGQPSNSILYTSFLVKIQPSAVIRDTTPVRLTERSIRGLVPGRRYIVTVRGVTSDGRRSPANQFHLWSEPLPPTALSLEAINSIQLSVSLAGSDVVFSVDVAGLRANWESSESMNGMAGYNVQSSPQGGFQMFPNVLEGDETEQTSRLMTGLTPGQEYTVTVRTQIGSPLDLVFSSPISETIRLPPSQPFFAEVTEDGLGATHAIIRAAGPLETEGIHTALSMELIPEHGEVGLPVPDEARFGYDLYTITDLVPETDYTLRIYALSHGVRSVNYIEIQFTTISVPGPPVQLEVTDFDSTSVELQWDQPPSVENAETIEYEIEFYDVLDIETVRTEIVSVESADFTVHVRIHELESGATYSFMIFTLQDGERSELQAEVVQTTVPPLPFIALLDGTHEGTSLVIEAPEGGQCPHVTVQYSPPLPTDTGIMHYIFRTGENFTLPGVPRDERYSIHIRCISNHVEGPVETISSRAEWDPEKGGPKDQTEPRGRLACVQPRVGSKPPNVEHIVPDACCNIRPYRKGSHSCCGSVIYEIDTAVLCCQNSIYSSETDRCCPDGFVRPRDVECIVPNP